MTSAYPFLEAINLHVRERITPADAQRQQQTARAILRRLETQPGVVLADEVGMGKTFVALAVAVSMAVADRARRPIVVMVPPALHRKWQSDFAVFREKCLPAGLAERLQPGVAERAEDFLKLLDDPLEHRRAVIFVTHGTMSRGLRDPFVKLAIIQRSLHRRRHTTRLTNALGRCLGLLLQAEWMNRGDGTLWETLLAADPERWHRILERRQVEVERTADGRIDEVVPAPVLNAIYSMDVSDLYEQLWDDIPLRRTENYDEYIVDARRSITASLKTLWRTCLKRMHVALPLLILDEAHHLKNARTQLASLFQTTEAQDDADELTKGELGGVFDRMLFLTATPFQLGHHELCGVLERFGGIGWQRAGAPPGGRATFQEQLGTLRHTLDLAQEAALSLDAAWGTLRAADLSDPDRADLDAWWARAQAQPQADGRLSAVVAAFARAQQRLQAAQETLAPWVIRHLKPRHLAPPHSATARRRRLHGAAILDPSDGVSDEGLSIAGEALLPFLLAARVTACTPESRPVFAEGLASSFEAFLQTRELNRRSEEELVDLDDAEADVPPISREAQWYLNRLAALLPCGETLPTTAHPKIEATVEGTLRAWLAGEKVAIFCHYIITGRVLRQRISDAMGREIQRRAAERLGCSLDAVDHHLERLGDRFFDNSPIRRACDAEVGALLAEFPALREHHSEWVEIVRRNLRTPPMLVRYFPLGKRLDASALQAAWSQADGSGLTLHQLLYGFFETLQQRLGQEERDAYLEAMQAIQTGGHAGTGRLSTFTDDELQGAAPDRLLANVRLVNGTTRAETRQRLMLAFNTPFSPDILIASSVMAEGVDLHLNCRTIIHHDLSWNPSTLEQRTGRVDRIGAKVDRCGKPIDAFFPYVAETQDEKMFRVVMDRERWFNLVMGEKYRLDARTTDRLADRVPLPSRVADALRLRLEVVPLDPMVGDSDRLSSAVAPATEIVSPAPATLS